MQAPDWNDIVESIFPSSWCVTIRASTERMQSEKWLMNRIKQILKEINSICVCANWWNVKFFSTHISCHPYSFLATVTSYTFARVTNSKIRMHVQKLTSDI